MADKKPEDAPRETERAQVTDEGLRVSFSGPAVRANKIYLSMTSGGVRIAFLEQHGDPVPLAFRTAVILSVQEALSLRDLLAHQLEGIEVDLKEAIKAAESEAKKEHGA